MSNSAIGTLYKRIIDNVVDTSRADFEENGVPHGTMGTFQETWQDHLSKRKTATFPWDPAPPPQVEEPAPPVRTTTSASNNATRVQAQSNANSSGPHIKQEPGQNAENNPMNMPPATGFANAQERAEHLVNQRRLSGVNTLQNSPISLPGQQNQSMYGSSPYQNQQMYQQSQQRPQSQWTPQQHANAKQNPQSQQYPDLKQQPPYVKQERPEGISLGQTDGAGDGLDPQAQWSAVMALNREVKADRKRMQRADGMVKRHVAEQMRGLEAGGLLVPIDERYSVKQRQGLSSTSLSQALKNVEPEPLTSGSILSTPQISQYDGLGDDDEDKDAINSDLDDPDDEAAGDGATENEYEGDSIICLYDKVQRVKNKWKCTLKDGVVNADGKDYVFHKANGEFEW